ncbi:MAG TPA: DUF3592 domain-containing protein [Pseudonocardiaceae bacterium]
MNIGSTSAGRTPTRTARPGLPRALWHGLLTTGAVLAVCAIIATFSTLSYQDATARLAQHSVRATGQVTGGSGTSADITWKTPAGQQLRAVVPMSGTAPSAGTRTEIAYDPADPADAIIPGAHLLADADQARDGLFFATLVACAVLAVDAVWLLRRLRLRRSPGGPLTVRRVRMQRRLMSRSWLETEPVPGRRQRWIPVYYDPVLAELPSPVEVTLRGDLILDRLVAVEVNGVLLYPSGRVAPSEPLGRRTDSPSRPDDHALAKARAGGILRQLRVDAALLVPAPLIGLFWAYLDQGGGAPSWLGATALCATLGLWLAAIRGSDPT